MTNEERKNLYERFHSGVRMMIDKVEKVSREKDSWTLMEMYQMADIMKDMSETEKNIAKAHMLYCENPEETY